MNMFSRNMDAKIRAALKRAEQKGQLCTVSAVTGITSIKLRQIMDSTSELPTMDRALLKIHLER